MIIRNLQNLQLLSESTFIVLRQDLPKMKIKESWRTGILGKTGVIIRKAFLKILISDIIAIYLFLQAWNFLSYHTHFDNIREFFLL